jgi:putative membrane protein
MNILASVAVWAIALLHVYILILEMFLWTTPRGHKAFGLTPEFARQTKALAANQGLYNGFLAAGLVWGLLHPDFMVGVQIQLFFLVCIAVAGVYGAITAKLSILFIQTLPAIIAIGLLGAATYFNVAQVAPT